MKASLVILFATAAIAAAEFVRPPSVPLVACDPYFSIWSPHDKLTDGHTTHWTGKLHRLDCMVSVDGTWHRLLGNRDNAVPALPQTGLEVTPTRTIASFAGAGVEVTLTFTTPALPDDLSILSRPVTYVSLDARATDGKEHQLVIDFSASAEIAVDNPSQEVVAEAGPAFEGLSIVKAGSRSQQVLARSGDDLRIDWGHFYMAAPSEQISISAAGPHGDDWQQSSSGTPDDLVLTLRFEPVAVGKDSVSRWLMLAYDDLYSIQFMKNNLRPYWRKDGWEAADLLEASARERSALMERCREFDRELTADLTAAGGTDYAYLGALAYRQCFAAGKFVADRNGQPLQFSKENHSNGCIATSDVFYPMSPQFLLFGPSLAKSFIVPFMEYARSDRWKFPFAPHDLGTYPHANGQRYGGGEESEENQMPVEESGNLLILFAAVAEMEGHAKFAERYWPELTEWAEYLKAKGFDPENQLCTDDFAGHLAHNVNLSAKAICGLACYGKLCALRGETAKAREYSALAKSFAKRWIEEAGDNDHYRLAFDRENTWSQKYNLVWDRILGLNLFPDEVLDQEMAYYRKVQNKFGLPLDNRRDYTKLDWILWTATLTRDRSDFEALIKPVRRFLDETPDRFPMTDWYYTSSGKRVGFTARPVVGGVFLEMLYHKDVWSKYAGRDKTKAAGWASMPRPPIVTTVVPNARSEKVSWKFTTRNPGDDWFSTTFDDGSWREGVGGFGTAGTPRTHIGSNWRTREIWLRRTFSLPDGDLSNLHLELYFDEDTEVYLNGIPALSVTGYSGEYVTRAIRKEALAGLKAGANTMAIHCRQTTGGQYIDAGLVTVTPAEAE